MDRIPITNTACTVGLRELRGCASFGMAVFMMVIASAAAAADRAVASLDGPWRFRMDPENVGETEGWFRPEAAFDAAIQVPGAWEAQGFGGETEKLRHHFLGKGWYRRPALVPETWAGQRIFLCVGGVHRYAKVWVNGHYLGEHIGYLSPFEYDVTAHVEPGASADVCVCVDSVQRWDIDTLIGCFDIIDYMDTYWGGIWGHVTLEARSAAHLEELFVQPRVGPTGCSVSARLCGDVSVCEAVRLEVLASDGKAVGDREAPLGEVLKAGTVALGLEVPDAECWSPDTPVLYTARLSLLRGAEVIDHVETRFGFRVIEIRGTHIYLNGKRIFLRGYGDDCVYPRTMAAPSDKATYLERLAVAKACGFTHVRHHSHMLPPEYYDACDEAGMLVSAEFPIAYQQFYDRAKDAATDLYKHEWSAAITRLRNHPSIFDWCMGNEMWKGVPLAPEFYRIAKALDPTRPVVDSDGLFAKAFVDGSNDRDTLDLYFAMFDVGNTPLDIPDKFRCPKPRKPVVSHETGNYVTFPRLDMIDLFADNFKPFWLTPVRARLEAMGLVDESERWALNSERLYMLCHKHNIEALRKSPNISGYHWWLLQDYWTTSNGIVDTYFRPKQGIDLERVRRLNGDVILLEDGLGLTYRGGDALEVALLVSNYAPESLVEPMLTWRVRLGDTVVAENSAPTVDAPQGEVTAVARLGVPLLDCPAPTPLRVEAELVCGEQRYVNDWPAWVYPKVIEPPQAEVPLFASPELLPSLTGLGVKTLPDAAPLPAKAVYVSSVPTRSMLEAMDAGACLLLLRPQGLFPAAATRFKTAWWHGNARDNNAGTVVYEHPVTRAMAPEGWCDAGWRRLIEGCDGYLLDAFPAMPEVLIRGIEVSSVCRNKALLFQAGVGSGSLVVCGLNLDPAYPEAAWLLSRLLEHAATLPAPDAHLPRMFIEAQIPELPQIEGPLVEGFGRLLRNEGEEGTWLSYREARAPYVVCRQTAPGHLVEWETAPAPEEIDNGGPPPALYHGGVTFVFAGGLGWRSQPQTEGFSFLVNGTDVLDFDVEETTRTWSNEERGVTLSLLPKKVTNEDAVGLFYVRVPKAMLTPGTPCRFAIRSKGADSQRWFALTPYPDVLAPAGRQSEAEVPGR